MNRKIIVKLKSKPISISPEYRLEYKICMLVMILHFSCRNSKGSVNKINYIMNSLCTHKSMVEMEMSRKASNICCDFDKTLSKVLNIAVLSDIVAINDGQILLLDKGEELIQLIIDNELFLNELNLLKNKKKDFITEGALK